MFKYVMIYIIADFVTIATILGTGILGKSMLWKSYMNLLSTFKFVIDVMN